jgi:septum formation inhibitor-activating ATPase MinD
MSDKDMTTKTIHKNDIISIAAILAIIFVYQTGILVDAEALTKYYNCTSRVANKNGTLSLQNIENCYDQVFKGAKQAEKDEADALKTTSPLQ